MTSTELVQSYLAQHFQIVTWPHVGDNKGPREPGWTTHPYTLEDYAEGHRVGIMTGVEGLPRQFLHYI